MTTRLLRSRSSFYYGGDTHVYYIGACVLVCRAGHWMSPSTVGCVTVLKQSLLRPRSCHFTGPLARALSRSTCLWPLTLWFQVHAAFCTDAWDSNSGANTYTADASLKPACLTVSCIYVMTIGSLPRLQSTLPSTGPLPFLLSSVCRASLAFLA